MMTDHRLRSFAYRLFAVRDQVVLPTDRRDEKLHFDELCGGRVELTREPGRCRLVRFL